MISAGTIDTKTVGTSFTASVRPGICFFTSAKFTSFGNCEKADGSCAATHHGPLASGALSHAPPFSRYQVWLAESLNTCQLVLTADDNVVPDRCQNRRAVEHQEARRPRARENARRLDVQRNLRCAGLMVVQAQ